MIKHISELVKKVLSKARRKSAERELFDTDEYFNTHYHRGEKERQQKPRKSNDEILLGR